MAFKDFLSKITNFFSKKKQHDFANTNIVEITHVDVSTEGNTGSGTPVKSDTGSLVQNFGAQTEQEFIASGTKRSFSLPPNLFKKSKTWGPLLVIAALAAMTADLVAIKSRSYMIPTASPSAKKINVEQAKYIPRPVYDDILARNIFNSDGIIPELQVAGANGVDINGPAKESQLELNLVGTIVHANPGKSVATIEFKNNPEKVLPYIPNDDIEGLATVMKIERKRVYIRNMATGAIEYIQIKDEPGISFQRKGGDTAKQDGPVINEGDNTYGINRTDLETQMQNLPDLLTQARALPNIVNGRVDGYKITELTDNALFKKFGIQDGDVIKAVDGEKLDSPAKAMELYNGLRNKSQIKMTVERNGNTSTRTYNIH